MDPFVATTAAACATEKLVVGTAVCLIAQRDPIVTAKLVASIDVVSNGRFRLGVGPGWLLQEMRNHKVEARTRMSRMIESVQAMIEIWTHDEAEFHGRFVDFDALYSWPKPRQRPYVPIIVGGNGPTVEDRVLAIGDEWMPVVTGDIDDLFRRSSELQQRAGRSIPLSLSAVEPKAKTLADYAYRGLSRALVWLPQDGHTGACSLGQSEEFLDEVRRNVEDAGIEA
jgi:probable F420-dependent oxidoreductase